MRRDDALADLLVAGMAQWDASRARSTQTHLGMSSLGGCREAIRATLAGDPRVEPDGPPALKWAAFVGTALGDLIETAIGATVADARTQVPVTVTLPVSKIAVSGSADLVLPNAVCDFKSKAYLDDVAVDGPTLQQWVQVSGYLVGLVQQGDLTEDAVAALAFVDRSGAQSQPVVFAITYAEAEAYLHTADERLADVVTALATGTARGALRDMPQSWCFWTACPFRLACWGEDDPEPTTVIDNPEHLAAIEQYARGRDLAKTAKAMQQDARGTLGAYWPADREAVTGLTDRWSLKWTMNEGGRFVSRVIDLRKRSQR